MKFLVTLDRDEEGVWIAECPAICGCISQGATREETLQNIREAIKLCLEVRAERGLPLTIETQQVEVVVECQGFQPCPRRLLAIVTIRSVAANVAQFQREHSLFLRAIPTGMVDPAIKRTGLDVSMGL
jgi:predicted RNase H-like HicB family nuclease